VDPFTRSVNRGGLLFPIPALVGFSNSLNDRLRRVVNLRTATASSALFITSVKQEVLQSPELFSEFALGSSAVQQTPPAADDLRWVLEGIVSKAYNVRIGELVRSVREQEVMQNGGKPVPESLTTTRELLKAVGL